MHWCELHNVEIKKSLKFCCKIFAFYKVSHMRPSLQACRAETVVDGLPRAHAGYLTDGSVLLNPSLQATWDLSWGRTHPSGCVSPRQGRKKWPTAHQRAFFRKFCHFLEASKIAEILTFVGVTKKTYSSVQLFPERIDRHNDYIPG